MARTYLIVVNRGERRDGGHGQIVERNVAESDVTEREREWHNIYAPCETYYLPDHEDMSALDDSEHQAVVRQEEVEETQEPEG